MSHPPKRRRAGVVAVVLAGLMATGCASADGGNSHPSNPGSSTGSGSSGPAAVQLGELTVRAGHSMRGYSRDRFPHWDLQRDRCRTREVVLARDGREVRTDRKCRIVSGRWVSPYNGRVHTHASEVDIDHVVPLANAWRSGADTWSDAQRERFANDLTKPQLFAVTASVNRAKGDQGPEAWRPPRRDYWCTYARNWITVKHAYRLSVTAAERGALHDMLARC